MHHTRWQKARSLLHTIAELVIAAVSIFYIVAGNFWALFVWEFLAAAYILIGLLVVWRGRRSYLVSTKDIKSAQQWAWVLPLLSSAAGINSAMLALFAKSDDIADSALAGAACAGILLSWILLHVGFAQMYSMVDVEHDHTDLEFPKTKQPVFLDYLYFSFTLGTSFATSDVVVNTLRVRRIVLIHGVISFLYNAIVVAVAFQVLQQGMS